MNVVVVNDYGHVNGGAAKVAISSAIGLAKRGHAVTYITAVAPVDAGLEASGVRVFCSYQKDILGNSDRLPAAIQGIWNVETKQLVDEALASQRSGDVVVHLHGWTKALSSSVVRQVIRRNIPVICTLHDYFIACPNGGLFNFQTNRICELRPMSSQCIASHCDSRNYAHKIWRVARQGVQQTVGLMRQVTNFIYVSEPSWEIIRQHLSPKCRGFFVENPIDAVRGESVDVEKNEGFVYVGRLSKEKGVLLLARVANQIRERVTFIGDGYCREEIARLCPRARVTGWVNADEVRKALRGARALVVPSLWYETQGMVVQEAAALGVPSVVSDSSVTKYAVRDGETGLLFKGGDENSLREKLEQLGDGKAARSMGKAAYEGFWSIPHTLSFHLDELQNVYEEILNFQKKSS